MSACIHLPDGKYWWAANWAYDAAVHAIADVLASSPGGADLATLLRSRTCDVQGPGLGNIDLTLLSPDDLARFRSAARSALGKMRGEGSMEWHNPAAFPGWLQHFESLVAMLE